MSGGPFRFVHTSDFHLDKPLGGLAEIPDHLREIFLEAPLIAAERTIAVAIEEKVDFVVLAGGIIRPHLSGIRQLVFLLEQFEKLAEHDIPLYWACSREQEEVFKQLDDNGELPDSIHFYPASGVHQIIHRRGGELLVELLIKSQESKNKISAIDFRDVSKKYFSIAIASGKAESKELDKSGIDYWALGGSSRRRTLLSGRKIAHYCGTPQGRSPQRTGPHGCTLVSVDEVGTARTQFIPTDYVRWSSERIELPAKASREDIEHVLRDRSQSLSEYSSGRHHLVSWTIAGGKELHNRFRREGLGELLSQGLRAEFGRRDSTVWTVSLEAELLSSLATAAGEEETILGDFLKIVREYQENDEAFGLDGLLPERLAAGVLSSATVLQDQKRREKILREVALLGSDLLGGQQPSQLGERSSVSLARHLEEQK